jgi:hypothetical protein
MKQRQRERIRGFQDFNREKQEFGYFENWEGIE